MMRKKTSQHGGHGGGHRNNRQRNKYRGGGGGGGGGGGNDSQSLARQKKHALAQKEKYQALARDMQMNGDRVNAEYYFQHVEHYVRVLAEIAEKEPPQQQRDFAHEGDEADDAAGAEAEGDETGEQPSSGGGRPHHHGRHHHRDQRQHRAAPVAADQDEPAAEIPLPGSLFGDDETDRAANG